MEHLASLVSFSFTEYRYIKSTFSPHPLADPDVVMTPPSVEPTVMVPDPGLFGARTPTSSIYDEPGHQRR